MVRTFNLRKEKDNLMKGIFFLCASFSIISLILIIVYLFINGIPFMNKIGFFNFIFGIDWSPISDSPSYGIFQMIVTTIYVTGLSVLIGGVIGVLTAICLYRFLPKKITNVVIQLINLLAGIPSVIYGLFGLQIIVPFVRDYISPNGVGYGILSSSIVLSIMILPTIVSISYTSLISVNEMYYEGALALGSSKEEAVFKIMVPAAKSGILSSIILGTGRALGETMAVIMVIGGSPQMPNSLFQSVRTLTSNIAMGATELSGDPLSALVASGVVLFVFAFLLNVSFSFLSKKGGKKNARKK